MKLFDFFRAKPVKPKVYAIFEETYNRVLNQLKATKIVYNAKQELLPFMWVLSDYAAINAGKDDAAVSAEIETYIHQLVLDGLPINYEVLNSRIHFYGGIVNGAPLRPDWKWLIDEETLTGENATPRLIIALVDILTNPACAEDYENAPLLIHEVFDVQSFTPIMIQVSSAFVDFFGKIYKA